MHRIFILVFIALVTLHFSCDPNEEIEQCSLFLDESLSSEINGLIYSGISGPANCIDTFNAKLHIKEYNSEVIQFELTNLDLNDIKTLEYYYHCNLEHDYRNSMDLISINLYYEPVSNFQDTTETIDKFIGRVNNWGSYFVRFANNDELCQGTYNSYFLAKE